MIPALLISALSSVPMARVAQAAEVAQAQETAQAPETAQAQEEGAAAIVVTPEQSRAVERGLAWLAANQAPDGSWIAKIGYKLNNDYNHTSEDRGHLGVTALACMAFLAGGHLPGRGVYGPNVERGLDFVLSCVQEDGYITRSGSRMYDHAFATLFLAEVCGMTHREDVEAQLQKAVDFIVKSQNDEGGWRYEPYSRESDMSIVVCQVIALRAARNIGIRVPKSTVDRAARYVVGSAYLRGDRPDVPGPYPMRDYSAEVGTFRYQKDVKSRTSFPLTAAGVTALHGLGVYSDDLIRKGLDYLSHDLARFDHEPSQGSPVSEGHYYFWYGHYYAVQAMYTAGSPYWEPYFEEVRRVLLSIQREDGSWPNAVGPGPAFGTAMGVLILEIPYRFLPIFQR